MEYFPEFKKFDQNSRIGMLLLNGTNSKQLAVYSQHGVQHYWDWGGENFNNYRIIIHPSGNGWLYNFENRKSNEQLMKMNRDQNNEDLSAVEITETKGEKINRHDTR